MTNNVDQINFETRYKRQIILPQIGRKGQMRLSQSKVFIMGMGGLGSPVSLYLAAAGIGSLIIADFDRVDPSNLQRQIIHSQSDIGELKSESALKSLKAINPSIVIETINYALDYQDLLEKTQSSNLLIDCTDNVSTRFDLNSISLKYGIPLVSGAAIRWEGQVTTFDPRETNSPCYRCLYPNQNTEIETCSMEGVISPLVGVIGTMQAMESVNVLLGQGTLNGVVWLFDALIMEWTKIVLLKQPYCIACGSLNGG